MGFQDPFMCTAQVFESNCWDGMTNSGSCWSIFTSCGRGWIRVASAASCLIPIGDGEFNAALLSSWIFAASTSLILGLCRTIGVGDLDLFVVGRFRLGRDLDLERDDLLPLAVPWPAWQNMLCHTMKNGHIRYVVIMVFVDMLSPVDNVQYNAGLPMV